MDTVTYLTNIALTIQGNSGGAGTKEHAKRVCIRPPMIIVLFGGGVVIITGAVWRFEFKETCNDSSWKATWFRFYLSDICRIYSFPSEFFLVWKVSSSIFSSCIVHLLVQLIEEHVGQ